MTQNNKHTRGYELGPRWEFGELGQDRAGWQVVPEDREHPALGDTKPAGATDGADHVVLEEGQTPESVLSDRFGLDELAHPD